MHTQRRCKCKFTTVYSPNAREVLKAKITEGGGEFIDNVATNTLSCTDAIDNFISMARKRKGGAADVVAQNRNISIDFQVVYEWPVYYGDIKSRMKVIILSNGDDIDCVFATFNGVSLVALQAVREAGLEDRIPIIGVDRDPEALNEIADSSSAYYDYVLRLFKAGMIMSVSV